MSLRKKACSSCVAAKRKCDFAFPACRRCVQRSLSCVYPYPPPTSPQDDPQHDPSPQDVWSSSLVGLVDSQTELPNWDMATEFSYAQDSLLSGEAYPILCNNPLSSGESTDSTKWPVSFDRRILEFYPRVDDTETWAFGVKTLLNQVDVFLRTGSAFFADPQPQTENILLLPPLRVAYGVCSSYKVRTESEFPFFQQLLENEVESLLELRPPDLLQEQVAEICAILLYYIIIHFGGTPQRGRLAERSETLLAQYTARVESLERETRQSTAILSEADLLSDEERLNLWHLCERARKLVMVSYLAREIRHVLRFKTCYLLRHIVALPVSRRLTHLPGTDYHTGSAAFEQWEDVVSYDRFVRDWEDGELGVADEFTYFLISACKGIRAL